MTRRNFVSAAALGAGAIVGLRGAAFGQTLGRAQAPVQIVTSDALSKLGYNSFLPFVNTDFTFGEGLNAVSLRLTDLTDSRPLRSRARKFGQENFVLKFTGSFRNPLKDGTYSVNHFNLGDFDMFITNNGRVGRVIYYTAVFNRVLVSEGN